MGGGKLLDQRPPTNCNGKSQKIVVYVGCVLRPQC